MWGPLTVRGRFEAGWDHFSPEDRDQQSTSATTALVADLKGAGRVEVVYGRDWISGFVESARLYADARPGWRLTLNGSLRPRPGYSTRVSIRIDQRDEQRRVVAGTMEMRAFF